MPVIPQPPVELTMPYGWQLVVTIMTFSGLAILGGYALRVWRRNGDVLPLLCLAGGALATPLEALVDVLGFAWYPRPGQWVLYELMGRPVPLLLLPGYTFFVGGLTVLALEVCRRGGPKALFRLWPLIMVIELPIEYISNNTGVYVYYGQQPLKLFEFPHWWLFVNTLIPMVAALVIMAVRDRLPGWRLLAVAVLIPMVDAGVNGALAWPVWIVLWSDVPMAVTQGAGVVTILMSVLLLRLLIKAEERRRQPALLELNDDYSRRADQSMQPEVWLR